MLVLPFRAPKFVPDSERRLIGIVSAVIVVIMTVYGTLLIVAQQRQLRAETEQRGLALARGMAAVGAVAAKENLFLMQEAFAALESHHNVRRAMVLAPDHMIVAANRPELIGRTLDDRAVAAAESGRTELLIEQSDVDTHDAVLVVMEPLWGDTSSRVGRGESDTVQVSPRQLIGWVRVELALKDFQRTAVRFLIQQVVVTALLLLVAVYGVTTTVRRLGRVLYASETRLRSIVETAGEGIMVVDRTGVIESANPAANALFGAEEGQLIGHPLSDLMTLPDECHAFLNSAGRTPYGSQPQTRRWEVVAGRTGGRAFPMELSISEMLIDGTSKFTCLFRDITERKRAEEEIHRLAYFDSLTGLPNRTLFRDRATQALRYARRHHLHAAVLFLDLDRFKHVNDSFGHEIGDMLLQAVAKRLTDSVRQSDSVGRHSHPEVTPTISRLGGDEFTVFLADLAQVQDAGTVGRRILDVLAEPFVIEGHEIFIGASIGIACFPTDADNLELLLKYADTAMYHAKNEGRNNLQFFSSSMNAALQQRAKIEIQLHKALEREEFMPFFQPRREARTGKLVGVEALVRWRHPERGILMPPEFVPVAQEAGLIREIDGWMLRSACQQTREWTQRGLPSLRVSVNMSNSFFRDKSFHERVVRALLDSNLPSSRLELELTESIILRHADAAIGLLRALKDLGVSLAIDDFGTGYSSLSYLHRLPVDLLKIDRSFIQDLPHRRDSATITRSVIALGHSLNLRVLAEGVETRGQLDFLIHEGCDEVQGYLVGHPLSGDQMIELLRQESEG